MWQYLVCCLLLALSLNGSLVNSTVTKSKGQGTKPPFCNRLDCPHFDVLEHGSGYELRKYPTAQWVSTKYSAMTHEDAQGMQGPAFRRLFKYISGENDKKEKIPMTAPVLTKVTPGAGPNCESTFVMSFYVPDKIQKSAPKPTSTEVFLENSETIEVYVKSFPGYASQDKYIQCNLDLIKAVGEDKVQSDVYFTAGYDSPFKFWGRHNECWVMKKSA